MFASFLLQHGSRVCQKLCTFYYAPMKDLCVSLGNPNSHHTLHIHIHTIYTSKTCRSTLSTPKHNSTFSAKAKCNISSTESLYGAPLARHAKDFVAVPNLCTDLQWVVCGWCRNMFIDVYTMYGLSTKHKWHCYFGNLIGNTFKTECSHNQFHYCYWYL